MIKKIALYSRASTKDQTLSQQLQVLREYCSKVGYEIAEEYLDEGISAFKKNRPAYLKIMDDARVRKFDLILVWKLDRWGRSLREVVNSMYLLKGYGIGFMSYQEKEFDTTTSVGELMFNIVACFANFERSLISERTRLKLGYLKSLGVKLGRPQKANFTKISELRSRGLSLSEISRETGIHRTTVSKSLKRLSLLNKPPNIDLHSVPELVAS